MKRILCLILALSMTLAITACGSEKAPTSPQTPEQTETASNKTEPPDQEKPDDYADVKAPFASLHDGAEISVKKRANIMELYLVCNDLSAESQPENWDDICSAAEVAASESQKITKDNYGIENIGFRIEDGSGTILCSGFGDGIKYDVYAAAVTAAAENDAKITLAEYNQIIVGMTYSQCVEIIGAEGTLDTEIGSTGSYMGSIRNYSWEGTTEYGSASITFDNFVVYSKFQVGLE